MALAANLALGALHSPLTALRIVRVEGAREPNKPYIRTVLGELEGKAALQTSVSLVESKLMATSAVRSADFQRNLFGRATLAIQYREPVARFEADRALYLDSGGTMFRSVEEYGELPWIDLYADAFRPSLTVPGAWPARSVAWLAKKSRNYDFGPRSTIEVQASGAVSLITNSKAAIRLGAPYELEEKLARLDELIGLQPDLLAKARAVHLVVPSRPTWTPR